jgi:hypothetical protein
MKKYNFLKVNIKQFDKETINLEAVKKFLSDNKENTEVKAYLGELSAPTVEGVEGFLDTPEGRKLLQPRLDSNFTKGLNTWKEKNLDKLVEDEVKKRNPEETPEQKELRKLREEIESERKARNRESLVNKALKVAKEKSLPDGIIDFFIAEDEEGTTANLVKLEEEYNKAVTAAVDAKFKENGRNFEPGGGSSGGGAIDIGSLAGEVSIRK